MWVAKPVWVIELKRGKRPHLVAADEFGDPIRTTLCGKGYTPEQRKSGGKKTRDIAEIQAACDECRHQLIIRTEPFRRKGIRRLELR